MRIVLLQCSCKFSFSSGQKGVEQRYILKGFPCRVPVFVLFEKLRNVFIGDIHKS